jgi:hypothetical protein
MIWVERFRGWIDSAVTPARLYLRPLSTDWQHLMALPAVSSLHYSMLTKHWKKRTDDGIRWFES